METILAIVIGGLYAAGIYMMLRRSLFKLILGIGLFGHGANLLIFTSAGLTRAAGRLASRCKPRLGLRPIPAAGADPDGYRYRLCCASIHFSADSPGDSDRRQR